MSQQSAAEILQDLNLWFLLALHDAAASDIPQACAEFGADAELATFVAKMPMHEIKEIARTPKLLFKPAFDAKSLAALVMTPPEHRRAFATIGGV